MGKDGKEFQRTIGKTSFLIPHSGSVKAAWKPVKVKMVAGKEEDEFKGGGIKRGPLMFSDVAADFNWKQ